MVRDAPTPHSPPIAIPNMARRMSRVVRFGEKPDANSMTESPTVGRAPEQVGTDRSHRQRQQNSERDIGDVCFEFLRDVLEHEQEQDEIESVKRPSEEGRRDYVLLFTRPTRERRDTHVIGSYGHGISFPRRGGVD